MFLHIIFIDKNKFAYINKKNVIYLINIVIFGATCECELNLLSFNLLCKSFVICGKLFHQFIVISQSTIDFVVRLF